MGIKFLETMMEKTRFEVEVPTMSTFSSESVITKAFDYHLTRDKLGRLTVPSQKGGYVGLRCYALNMDKWF